MINIPKNVEDHEFSLYKSAYAYCKKLMSEEQCEINIAVQKTVDRYAFLITDCDQLRCFLLAEVTAFTTPPVAIIDKDLENKDWWINLKAREDFKTPYWARYREYLDQKPSWSLQAIQEIDASTDMLMNVVTDAHQSKSGERMGMVFGYVQSGKTANYLGLMNKAIDAGYKIIIILTGMHNSLRSQTQSRIDEEVLGYETSLEYIGDMMREKNAIGVGLVDPDIELVQSITTRDEKGDVNKKTEGVSIIPPFIIVTKKNGPILKRITRYLDKSPFADKVDGRKIIPAKYPALIIDDEADQASINTNESYDERGNVLEDYSPTAINGLIRGIFQRFESRTYVGYTATPFANIFIPPYLHNETYGADLYPRDFIFRMERPDRYIGAREFFGLGEKEDTPTMPLSRNILAGANYLGAGTKNGDPVGEIPDELKGAIRCFLISVAVRNCRGQVNLPNTMLIHIIRFVSQQKAVAKKVKTYLEEITNYIQYQDASIEEEFRLLWEDDYLPTTEDMRLSFDKYMQGCDDVEWHDVWTEIQRLVIKKEIRVYSVNGKSDDVLIYKNHQGKPFNVIVIGGDKLSRGLTLEGLSVSYFTRSSSTYDTLMQMGRWFGFRSGYADMCRLFTTAALRAKFIDISIATEDLAAQFDQMNDMLQTPKEFGLRVAAAPNLEITSRNKLRTGANVQKDFSGKLSQTRVFDIDVSQFEQNFYAVEGLLESIKNSRVTAEKYEEKHGGRKAPGNHLFWCDVSGRDIATFLESYKTSKSATRANSKYMAEYIKTMNVVGGVVSWTVCLMNVNGNGIPFDIADIKGLGAGIERTEGKGVVSGETTCSIQAMTSAGHEYFDYTSGKIDEANRLSEEYKTTNGSVAVNEKVRCATRDFEKGLLILYPIASAGKLRENLGDHKTPFGFAVVFPDRKGQGDLKSYRMTDVALENENEEFFS